MTMPFIPAGAQGLLPTAPPTYVIFPPEGFSIDPTINRQLITAPPTYTPRQEGFSRQDTKSSPLITTPPINNLTQEGFSIENRSPSILTASHGLDVNGTSGVNVNKDKPLDSEGLHKASYLDDHGKILLGDPQYFHGEILSKFGFGNTDKSKWWKNEGGYPERLPYFDKPEHVRTIIDQSPKSVVIGVRPSQYNAGEFGDSHIELSDRYDSAVTNLLKKAQSMTDKKVYVRTDITNDMLQAGTEKFTPESMMAAVKRGQVYEINPDFWKKNIIIGGQVVKKRR